MKPIQEWHRNGFCLRPAQAGDAEAYFRQNYDPLDPEVARLTGSKSAFSHAEVTDFFRRCVAREDYYLFLALSPEGSIIGETALTDLDPHTKSANFRIALFHPQYRNAGLGSWMTAVTRDFAFGVLGLHRLSLEVFSFNPRAQRVYQKAGFRREGMLRDAVLDGQNYGDIILMSLLEQEWHQRSAPPDLT